MSKHLIFSSLMFIESFFGSIIFTSMSYNSKTSVTLSKIILIKRGLTYFKSSLDRS
jgi:hypothetical protein